MPAIEQVLESIAKHRDLLAWNETQTRVSLVDPVLTALGWNLADIDQTQVEYRIKDARTTMRVDYALLRPDGSRPLILVEAKSLGTNLMSVTEQIVRYAILEGVRHAVITDGDRWLLYDVFAEKPLVESVLLDVTLSQIPIPSAALQLAWLWRPTVQEGTPDVAPMPVLLIPENSKKVKEEIRSDTSNKSSLVNQEWTGPEAPILSVLGEIGYLENHISVDEAVEELNRRNILTLKDETWTRAKLTNFRGRIPEYQARIPVRQALADIGFLDGWISATEAAQFLNREGIHMQWMKFPWDEAGVKRFKDWWCVATS